MRIALITSEFPAVSETFVLRRVTELLARGWDVHVVCDRSPNTAWHWFPDEAEILRGRVHARRRMPSRMRVALSLPFTLIHTLIRAPLGTLRYLAIGAATYGRSVFTHFAEDALLVRLRPQVIHFEFGHLAVNREAIGKLIGAGVVASFQGYDLNYVGLDAEPGYYAELWERADAVHVVSRDLLARAKRRGLPSDVPTFVVMNGVDSERFSNVSRSHTEVVGSATRPLRLLSVGRLHWKKGYSHALEAVRILRDNGTKCDYRIVGDGEHRDAVLFDRADLDLDGCVTLLGAKSAEEVRDLLAWADVFVHPAVSEGFCLAVAEAQAMSVPVVSSDADGLRENVADGVSGYVVARRDPRALADRMSQLAADPALRQQMGCAGRQRVVSQFGWHAHVDGMEAVYLEAARPRTGRRRRRTTDQAQKTRT